LSSRHPLATPARLRRDLDAGSGVGGIGPLVTRLLRDLAVTFGSAVAEYAQLVDERARLLGEEIDSRVAEATNRNLYFVSVIAVLFMPVTLISGICGMNIAGLLWLNNSQGFLWVMLCMGAAILFALIILRWRGLL
jgi:zinc transporter